MKTSVCFAVVVALLVMQVVNGQETTTLRRMICPRCLFKCPAGTGPRVPSSGCPICRCPTTCKEVECPKDDVCVLKKNDECKTTTCPSIPTCVPRHHGCPMEPICMIACPDGFKTDKNGCPLCDCKE